MLAPGRSSRAEMMWAGGRWAARFAVLGARLAALAASLLIDKKEERLHTKNESSPEPERTKWAKEHVKSFNIIRCCAYSKTKGGIRHIDAF